MAKGSERIIYTGVMAYALPDHLLSVAEYLEFEQKASVRHEYVAGTLYALAGATRRHNLIKNNLVFHLWAALRRTSLRVYSTSLKLYVANDLLYYPDVMVAYDDGDDTAIFETKPHLLIEVLSVDTAHIDKREKLIAYRQIESLQTYLLVYQDRKLVERHWRDTEGRWQHAQVSEGEQVALECPALTLSVEEVYEGIRFQ